MHGSSILTFEQQERRRANNIICNSYGRQLIHNIRNISGGYNGGSRSDYVDSCLQIVETYLYHFQRDRIKINGIRMNCSLRQIEIFIQELRLCFINSDYYDMIRHLPNPYYRQKTLSILNDMNNLLELLTSDRRASDLV